MAIILFIPKIHFKEIERDSAAKWGCRIASALADNGHVVYCVLPTRIKGEQTNTLVSKNVIPVYVNTVKDHLTGMGIYTEDLFKLLSVRQSPIPFDVVLNCNTAMTLGLRRLLSDVGWSKFHIPVITLIELAASHKEWFRAQVGDKEWYRAWEILEGFSVLLDHALIGNKYDYELMRLQARDMMSLSLFRDFLSKLTLVKWPVTPLLPPYKHNWRKGTIFKVLLAGAFGVGWEEKGAQAEASIDAIRRLRMRGKNAKLIVCTQTPRNKKHDELLEGTEDFVEVNWNPSRELYMQKVKECHATIYAREYDGLHLALIEQLMLGKPIAWLASRFQVGIVDPVYNPPLLEVLNGQTLSAALNYIMNEYQSVSTKAYNGAILRYVDEYSPPVFASVVSEVVNKVVYESEERFRRSTYKILARVFSSFAEDGMEFDAVYKLLSKKTNNSMKGNADKPFRLYSRAWVMKMLRRYSGVDAVVEEGKLIVR